MASILVTFDALLPAPQGLVSPLYQCVLARLSAPDQDQEVKECAISCMAAAVAALGDVLGADVNQVRWHAKNNPPAKRTWRCFERGGPSLSSSLCPPPFRGLAPFPGS